MSPINRRYPTARKIRGEDDMSPEELESLNGMNDDEATESPTEKKAEAMTQIEESPAHEATESKGEEDMENAQEMNTHQEVDPQSVASVKAATRKVKRPSMRMPRLPSTRIKKTKRPMPKEENSHFPPVRSKFHSKNPGY